MGAPQPDNSLCWQGHVASHVTRLFAAGVLTHLFSQLFLGYQAPVQVLPGSQPHGQRLRALTFLAGAVWLRVYAD